MAAMAAIQQQKIEDARRYLEHASKLYPDDERIIQQLIRAERAGTELRTHR